jgi:hypothetical protein
MAAFLKWNVRMREVASCPRLRIEKSLKRLTRLDRRLSLSPYTTYAEALFSHEKLTWASANQGWHLADTPNMCLMIMYPSIHSSISPICKYELARAREKRLWNWNVRAISVVVNHLSLYINWLIYRFLDVLMSCFYSSGRSFCPKISTCMA